ncbi:MAG: proline iminopeptidase-family hydrolase, partial [Mycobacteriales bacterium]
RSAIDMSGTTEGYIDFRGHRTWYRVTGELTDERVPAVICHGGPGATSDYVTPIAELARDGRATVLYDQLGNGRSDHLPDVDPGFWTVQLFKDELVALTESLGIADRYSVVGQSWGGMLAMEHALTHPAGLRAIVVADSPASIPLWVAEANRLRAQLPAEVQETLTRHEAAGTTDDPAYERACMAFYERHVCRVVPFPDFVARSFAAMAEDPTVYGTMNGPSEFHVIGTIKDWDITERLAEIDVPTLLVSGRYDEATPAIVGRLKDRIPGSEWELFEESSHLPHVEETERFLQVVGGFLRRHD